MPDTPLSFSFIAELPLARSALEYAQKAHRGQRRGSDDAEFIIHPLEVASLLRNTGHSEKVIAAAVLHDTIEDTDTANSDLAARFGEEVAALVATLSENTQIDSFKERKAAMREQIAAFDSDAISIDAADKVAKVRELRAQAGRDPEMLTGDQRPAAERIEHYVASLQMLEQADAEHPLVRQLRFELEALRAAAPCGRRQRSRDALAATMNGLDRTDAEPGSARMSIPGEALVRRLAPISLPDLDDRAALQRRVDRKYVLGAHAFEELLDRLSESHVVLEIDRRRLFAYRSVYFDSPDLKSFHDHVAGRRPRFKARTRLYRDTGTCHFEVKVKARDDQTDKSEIDHPRDRSGELTPDAERFLESTLVRAGIEPPHDLHPLLSTAFHRLTLASCSEQSRLTCDLGLVIARIDGPAVAIGDRLVIVESKSERGASEPDRALAEMGDAPVSLSKYRAGVELLVQRDRSDDYEHVRALFRRCA